MAGKPLGAYLLEAGVITNEQLEVALREGWASGQLLGEVLIRLGFAYDVILSDIVMPGLSGLQLLSLIKARTPSPDVILFTGFSTRERAMEALERGAFAYLEKPFDVAELLERVKQALWKRKLENGNGNGRR